MNNEVTKSSLNDDEESLVRDQDGEFNDTKGKDNREILQK